jgi:tetraacyldisaccharide 4'-kinase
VELLIVSPADLDEQVLPAGALRENLSVARYADAVLVPGSADDADRVAQALGVARAFRIESAFDIVRDAAQAFAPGEEGGADGRIGDDGVRRGHDVIAAVAGIARPQRFFRDLRVLGWKVAVDIVRPDHHWYDAADVARIESAARDAGAVAVMTNEKDAVRLQGLRRSMPWFVLPLRVAVLPENEFGAWLHDRIAAARHARPARQDVRSR